MSSDTVERPAPRPASAGRPSEVLTWATLRANARGYIGTVTIVGVGLIVYAIPQIRRADLAVFATLAVLSVITSVAKVNLPVPRSASTLTICYVIDFTTLLLLGPYAATLTASLSAWSQCTLRQRVPVPRFQTWFSVATLAVTVQATGFAFTWLGGEPGLHGSILHADALVAAAAIFFLVNSLLVAAAVALTTQQSTVSVWSANYLWSWPGHLLGFSLAVGAAAGIGRSMWWIVPFALGSLALTFENFRAYVTRFSDSVTDALTGLPNVRYLQNQAAQEIARSRRNRVPLAVMLVDLDGFKSINDSYGHQAGDVALRQVGACLQQSFRSYDICARYGGDEFVGVLPGCSIDSARRKAAALQTAVALLAFEPKPGIKAPLRISVGVSVFPEDGETLDALLKAADTRMFEDKGDHAATFATRRGAEAAASNAALSSLQREDQELRDRLMQAQRMEAIGQLAGGVAHDFNNVLTAILGYSELLTEQIGPDKAIGRDLQQILGAAKHAAALTHQLLSFSRRQDRVVKIVDLNQVIDSAESLLRRLLGERIAITTKLGPGLCSIVGDPTQLEQIVINLAVNARDAMPNGGGLTIETRNVELTGGVNHVELTVSDCGAGIPPDVLPKIFEPFFTTKEAGKGTGLGLAAVRSIIEQMEGHLAVESEPGRGTTFRIYLLSSGVAAQPLVVAQPAVSISVPVGVETILLVEDEAAVRQFATVAFERHGYRVIEAHSGEAALTLLDRYIAPVDMMMTDLVLPGMDGWELAERAESGRPEMKVLFTTGYDEGLPQRAPRRRRRGEVQVLSKPFTAQTLLTKTRELLDRRVA